MRAQPTITVFTREGCHLCDEAITVVWQVARGRAHVELIDIDADPLLAARYTVRVPVVALDGREIADYQIAADHLRSALDERDESHL